MKYTPVPCDRCGKPILAGQPTYGLAWKQDPDTGQTVSGRHWDCHTPIETLFSDLKRELKKVRERLQ